MAWDHQQSTTERGYGWRWQNLRKHVMRRDMYLCQPCQRKGRPTPATEVDHITPKSQDGTDDMENLEAVCTSCHQAKTAREATGSKDRPAFDKDGFPIW
jgi:5-methylcytosine-specific restriction protein A